MVGRKILLDFSNILTTIATMPLPTYDYGTHPFDAKYDVLRSVTLQMTDFEGGNNKFYQMELHKDGQGRFRIYSAYGRTGKTPVKEERVPTSEGQATSEFDKIQKSKEKKGYRKVDMVATSHGSEIGNQQILSQDFKKDKVQAANVVAANLRKLDASISSLVERLYTEAGQACKSQLNGSLQSTATNPLGTLSLTQLNEGKAILAEINKLLSSKKSLIDSIEPEVIDLSNKFYSAIPQEIPLRPKGDDARKEWMRRFALNNAKILDEKNDLIDLLGDVKGMMAGFATSDIAAKYDQLNCDIELVTPDEFKKIKDFLEGTQSRHHNWKLTAKRIWKVSSKGQKGYRKYMDDIGNITPLFHGSRASNIMGICKKGLLLRPPGAYVTGSMFGNGLYFADQSTKSSQYATARFGGSAGYGDTYFMFVADVALGKIKKYEDAQTYLQKAPHGYDSVQGEKGRSLIHNEFIVYDVRQDELRYLIEFEQKYGY
jgi:poly [ADP-ribose] polymerase